MELHAGPWEPSEPSRWDAFVRAARNGCFLFQRGYLDYHADRFDDASLAVQRDGELLAVLPAHRVGTHWVSHGGLTFGGLVLHPKTGAQSVLEIVDALADHLRARGATRLVYKPLPHIYHRQPSEDDLYALHRIGARTVRCELSTTIDLQQRAPLAKGRRHALAKAQRAGVQVRESGDYPAFWAVLERTLAQQHGVKPTHSAAEMRLLASRFEQIALHGAWLGDELVAGVVSYDFGGVLHTQYMAASDTGRETGALDAVIVRLIESSAARWFNFGASTFHGGRQLNAGLAAQKEMFGGRSTVLTTLEVDL